MQRKQKKQKQMPWVLHVFIHVRTPKNTANGGDHRSSLYNTSYLVYPLYVTTYKNINTLKKNIYIDVSKCNVNQYTDESMTIRATRNRSHLRHLGHGRIPLFLARGLGYDLVDLVLHTFLRHPLLRSILTNVNHIPGGTYQIPIHDLHRIFSDSCEYS